MTPTPELTPRDKLHRIGDLASKTMRYWWLMLAIAVVGGVISVMFATFKTKKYQSWATLFYQERIQSQLMTPNREELAQRNIGDRYREILLARSQLEQIINDPKLDPFPRESDKELKLDELRLAVKFEARGQNAFRVVYTDSDPDRAKAVTEKLTKLLQEQDEALRNDQASRTVAFATEQKEAAATELRKAEHGLAEFLAKHPEFAQDNAANTEGDWIRARNQKPTARTSNPRLYALERQRVRIQARLDAPPDAPPIRIETPATPERIAAEAAANEAQREVVAANRALEEALSRYTDRHPTVIKAQDRVASAQQKYRAAQAAIPPKVETAVAPATPQDRAKLQKELAALEQQIANEQKRTDGKATSAIDNTTNWVVQLETEHAKLRREVNEQRERVESLAASVFRAQIDASQKLAEQGGRLTVVDPAFKPARPSGPGRSIFILAGLAMFVTIGLGVAIGLAAIDDRVYRRTDLGQLGLPVLGEVPRGRRTVRPAVAIRSTQPLPQIRKAKKPLQSQSRRPT